MFAAFIRRAANILLKLSANMAPFAGPSRELGVYFAVTLGAKGVTTRRKNSTVTIFLFYAKNAKSEMADHHLQENYNLTLYKLRTCEFYHDGYSGLCELLTFASLREILRIKLH